MTEEMNFQLNPGIMPGSNAPLTGAQPSVTAKITSRITEAPKAGIALKNSVSGISALS